MSSAARFQAAAGIVRRLNAAVKSRRLYAAGHPLRAQTISAFLGTVVAYHERFGGFVLETHRQGLIVEGKPFEGGESVDQLAVHLYAMGIWQLIILPGLTEAEADATLDIVCMEREAIMAGGGIVAFLTEAKVVHVRVVELKPGEENVAEITPEVFQHLLDGALSAHDRAMILGLLRSGPDQAARLVGVVVERARQAFPDAKGEELAKRIYQALTALDRLIVDSPPGESQDLLKHLATAVSELQDPTSGGVPKWILAHAGQDLSARALLKAMTSDQIARMVLPCLEAGDPPPQVAQIVQGMPFDPAKARETLALISQQTGRSFDMPPVIEELTIPQWIHNLPQDLEDFRITSDDVKVTDEDIKALVAEARTDDDTIEREHTLVLLRLAAEEEDAQEREGALEILVRLPLAHLQQGQYDLAVLVMRGLDALVWETGPRAEAASYALRTFLPQLAFTYTLRDIWVWNEDYPLLRCLKQIWRSAVPALVQVLAGERDPGRRKIIAAMLAKIGEVAVESLAPHLNDTNEETVRAAIQALGQMGNAKGARTLAAVARHADPKLRREAIEILRAIRIPQAQETMLAFLRDPDLQVREYCVAHLDSEIARGVNQQLAAMLEEPGLARAASLRIQICEALVRAKAVEAIPALRRHASPFKLRRRDREFARRVRIAVSMLSRMPASTPATSATGRRRAS
jgi:HEAT repeat protein